MESIVQSINEEIDRQVNERITKILEMISKTYNIKYDRLLKDYSSSMTSSATVSSCCGITKTGKRCNRPGKFEGFCKIHMSQKPDVRIIKPSSPHRKTPVVTHTHSIPPLFLKGCPGCEASSSNVKRTLKS